MNAFSLESLPPQVLQSILEQLAQWGIIPDISKDYDPRITKGMMQVPGTERYQYQADPFTVPKTIGGGDPSKNVFSGPIQLPTLPTASDMEQRRFR